MFSKGCSCENYGRLASQAENFSLVRKYQGWHYYDTWKLTFNELFQPKSKESPFQSQNSKEKYGVQITDA